MILFSHAPQNMQNTKRHYGTMALYRQREKIEFPKKRGHPSLFTHNTCTCQKKVVPLHQKSRKTMKTLNSKEIIAIWFAIIAACISITALWMPPQGIIDETVLILIGQLLLFIATLVGVDGALMRLYRMKRGTKDEPVPPD